MISDVLAYMAMSPMPTSQTVFCRHRPLCEGNTEHIRCQQTSHSLSNWHQPVKHGQPTNKMEHAGTGKWHCETAPYWPVQLLRFLYCTWIVSPVGCWELVHILMIKCELPIRSLEGMTGNGKYRHTARIFIVDNPANISFWWQTPMPWADVIKRL